MIDGASTDGTVGWLDELDHPCLHWLSRPDDGLYDAMNTGIEYATGDYLLFLNAGDCLTARDVLARVATTIQKEPKQPFFIYGDAIDITLDGHRRYRRARSHRHIARGMFTHHQAMLFDRAMVDDCRYRRDLSLSADYAFVADFLKRIKNTRIMKVDLPIAMFLRGGVSERKRLQALRQDYRVRRDILHLSWPRAQMLAGLHLLHLGLKRLAPSIAERLRYGP